MDHSHDFASRVTDIQDALQTADIDVAVLLESRNQFYVSGLGLRGAVIVPLDAPPVHLVQLNVQRARAESAIEDVRPSRGIETVASVIEERVGTDDLTVGIETDVVPVDVASDLRSHLPAHGTLEPVAPLLLDQRRCKSTAELERIERAAEISRETFEAVPAVVEESMTELELKSKLQYVKRSEGAEDGMWSRAWDQHLDFGTLNSGPNTAVISGHWVTMTGNGPSPAQPYGASHREIQTGDLLIVDHQTVFRGYHCDEARTFVVGEATDRHRSVHETLRKALAAAEESIEPGNRVGDVYDAAWNVVSETPYAEQFMGLDQVGFEYVGHMVGLNADEKPLISPWEETEIEPGMVFAVEPKVIFEDEGLTLEDTIVATANGSRRLTSTPRTLVEL